MANRPSTLHQDFGITIRHWAQRPPCHPEMANGPPTSKSPFVTISISMFTLPFETISPFLIPAFKRHKKAGIKSRQLGVVFENLRVVGLDVSASFQPTLGSLLNPLIIFNKIRSLRHPPLKGIISGFRGVVRPGEMLRKCQTRIYVAIALSYFFQSSLVAPDPVVVHFSKSSLIKEKSSMLSKAMSITILFHHARSRDNSVATFSIALKTIYIFQPLQLNRLWNLQLRLEHPNCVLQTFLGVNILTRLPICIPLFSVSTTSKTRWLEMLLYEE